MSDFIASYNLFGEFDHFEDGDETEEKWRRESKTEEMRYKEVTPETHICFIIWTKTSAKR